MGNKGRGALIVVEGLDRSGKSTQCELLCTRLQEEIGDDMINRDSDRYMDRSTPIGRMINNYLLGDTQQEDHVVHLLFSANRWEAAPQMEADLNSGVTYIVDRYIYSGCVYSAAKKNPSLDLRWARQPEEGLPKPDLCVFLDISYEKAADRGGYGLERYERQEMQREVRKLYEEILKSPDGDIFYVIDAGMPLMDVHRTIKQKVLDVVARVKEQELPLQYIQPS